MSDKLSMSRVSEEVVRAEPRPEFTETWRPFSHSEVINAVTRACVDLGFSIGEKEYSIRKDSKCLAVYEISNGQILRSPLFSPRIVWRNSIDMTHSFAIGIAFKMPICSNMQFSHTNFWVTFRKHTGQLTIEEITFYAECAIKTLIPQFEKFATWNDCMKAQDLTYEQASALAVFSMNRGYLPPAQFPKFWEIYHGSNYRDHANTLFAYYQANTELMRENNMLVQLHKQNLLQYFVNYEATEILKRTQDPTRTIEQEEIIDLAFEKYGEDRKQQRQLMQITASTMRSDWKEKVRKEKEIRNTLNGLRKQVQEIKKVADEKGLVIGTKSKSKAELTVVKKKTSGATTPSKKQDSKSETTDKQDRKNVQPPRSQKQKSKKRTDLPKTNAELEKQITEISGSDVKKSRTKKCSHCGSIVSQVGRSRKCENCGEEIWS